MRDASILVGDIGGTNVRFAVVTAKAGDVSIGDIWKRPGADYPTFIDALAAYRREHHPHIDGAAFGLAGPVRGDRVELLNRGWTVQRDDILKLLHLERVVMANDFVAMARSAPQLAPRDVELISEGEGDPDASLAVGGPGTGFGIAIVRRLLGQDGWVVVGGEGGHQAFVPQTEIEWRLWQELSKRNGYVSNEMVAAGVGFSDTLAALAVAMGKPKPAWSEQETHAAADAGDPLAVEFCRLRARTVMTAMGNLALVANATGGVLLAGGVSTRIVRWLKEDASLDRFYQRGLRTELLARVPIRLITADEAPLLGAVHLWLDEEQRGWL